MAAARGRARRGRERSLGTLRGGFAGGKALRRGRAAAEPTARAATRSAAGAERALAASTRGANRPSRRWDGYCSTSATTRPRWRPPSSPSAPMWRPRRTSEAGSIASACGTSAIASTGSPTTATRSCAGARARTASTSSWGSRRATWSGLLGELGATWSRDGQPLLPIGTLYDPFVNRALEPWSFGIYAGGQSILVGTPSGVTLAPEGGAHQSIITPSVGLEQPRCIAWEPAFGQDLRVDPAARARAPRPRRRRLGATCA